MAPDLPVGLLINSDYNFQRKWLAMLRIAQQIKRSWSCRWVVFKTLFVLTEREVFWRQVEVTPKLLYLKKRKVCFVTCTLLSARHFTATPVCLKENSSTVSILSSSATHLAVRSRKISPTVIWSTTFFLFERCKRSRVEGKSKETGELPFAS